MLAPNVLLQNRYLVLRPIGRGGMGAVYEAQDLRLRATVALKETLLTDDVSRRAFEREAQLLARLRHPVLPKVIDHFTEELGQFLVMEFIAGDDLATLMEKRGGSFPLSSVVPWVVRWADQLLDALAYLHRQTPPVIHRDIKPQNLKLTARGEIILLDFGLAKGGMSDLSTVTRSSNMLGFTPNYAPLEQIRGGDPDPRSDLYSLAATLYNLLTGTKPPDALTRVAALLNDQDDPLRPANEVNPHVPPPVAAVLHRALATNPDERFETAGEMRRAFQEAQQQRSVTPGASPIPAPATAGLPVSDPLPAATTILPTAIVDPGEPGENTTRTLPPGQLPPPAPVAPGTLLQTLNTGGPVLCIALHPNGTLLAAGSDDGSISLWDIASGESIDTLYAHVSDVLSVAFSPDGHLLVSGSDDKTVCLWDVPTRTLLSQSDEYPDPIECVAISPDGRLLALGGWGNAVSLCAIQDNSLVVIQELPTGFVHSVTFSPDGHMLATGCYDTSIRLWQVENGELAHILKGHSNFVLTVAFSPSGKTLASGGGGTDIRLWRLHDGRLLDIMKGHTNFVRRLVFSPNGRILASASEDKTVRVWQASDGTPLHVFASHTEGVTSVLFNKDGSQLISGSRDTKLRIWQAG